MGLVGYRDRGDAYVTAFTPLSDDLDAVVARLMQFEAVGGGEKNFIGSRELVHDMESGDLDLAAMPRSDLPAELQGMSEPALAAHIEARGRERKQLQSQINDLAKKRQHFIEDKVRNEKDGGADSLDTKIYRCIQAQAARKGIDYTGGPTY